MNFSETNLSRAEERRQKNKLLQKQYEELAKDLQYQKETKEFIDLVSQNYAKNVLAD